jgi:hypothetical protein
MKTFLAKKETVQPKWHLIDAEGVPLGRLAVKAANIIRGRHKAYSCLLPATMSKNIAGLSSQLKGKCQSTDWIIAKY